MSVPDNAETAIDVNGDGNVSVGGDVDGDIINNVTKHGDSFQLFGDARGFHDIVIRDEIAPSHLAWLLARFAEPDEFGEIVRCLSHNKVLFLSGPAHSGRWTTAVCALAKASGAANPTINVIDFDEETQLKHRRVAEKANVLLDLTFADDSGLPANCEEQVRTFVSTVENAEGHLVVLLPAVRPEVLQPLYQDRLRTMTAPAAAAVLRAHLEKTEVPEDEVAKRDQIGKALESAHPADGERMAKLVVDEYRLAGEGVSIAEVVDKAIRAYENWSAELIATYDRQNDPDHRGLALSLGLLNGGTTEVLYRAEQELRVVTGYPVATGQLLEGRGFVGRLAALSGVSFTDDRARFDRLGYDLSVLQHAWRGYPELRRKLVDWVIKLGCSPLIKQDSSLAAGMTDRFFDLCVSQGAVRYVCQAAKRWAASGKSVPTQLAVRLLTVGASDERSAKQIHRQLYAWAGNEKLSPELVNLVLAVCRSEFSRRYTDKALTRLGRLADHPDQAVSDKVVATVLAIVREKDALPQVLAKIEEWLRSDKRRQRAVAVQVLLALTSSAESAAADPQALVQIWAALLAQDDRVLTQGALRSWLELALAPEQRDLLISILVRAVATAEQNRLDRIGAVSRAADGWVGFVRYWQDENHPDARVEVRQALEESLRQLDPFAGPASEGEVP